MSKPDREAMLDRDCVDLSMRRQCALLRLARSGVYRRKAAPDPDDLAVMRRIDELYLAMPFYGSRKMVVALRAEGLQVNRKRVRRLMRLMGLEALVPKPGTSKASPQNKIYPYLLRGVTIDRPNHVWAADITYIPMAKGFLYLVAVIDWASRAVLAWRLSNTIDTAFCLEALQEALATFGKPEIFNTDQGRAVHQHGLHRPASRRWHTHLDGRTRRWIDNVFIERVWRSLKYEEVHLKAYAGGREARIGIGDWMIFYNTRRFHQSLRNKTPMAVWHAGEKAMDMALRLDNARALPTCPQPQQQTQAAIAA